MDSSSWRDVYFTKTESWYPQSPLALLKEYHDSPLGGHAGELKTYLRLATEWYWVGMRKDISTYIRACTICQKQKALNTNPAGLLQPLPIPAQVWDEITMDFIEGLPRSQGMDTVLVVVDRLTKYAHFVALRHPFTASSVAALFCQGHCATSWVPQLHRV